MIAVCRNTSWNINEGNDDSNKLTMPVKKMPDNDNESMADNEIIRFALVLRLPPCVVAGYLLTLVSRFIRAVPCAIVYAYNSNGGWNFLFSFVSLFLRGDDGGWKIRGEYSFAYSGRDYAKIHEDGEWSYYTGDREGTSVNTTPAPGSSQPADET